MLTANETEHQKQKPTFVVAWVLFRFLLLDDPLLLLDVAILLLDDPFLLLEVPPEKKKKHDQNKRAHLKDDQKTMEGEKALPRSCADLDFETSERDSILLKCYTFSM